jgi:hypothetical protein
VTRRIDPKSFSSTTSPSRSSASSLYVTTVSFATADVCTAGGKVA